MRRNLLLGNDDFDLFLTGEFFNIFPKNYINQNCQNQSQSKCSTAPINKFIELIYCHLFFLSKAIAKPRDIIVKSILQVNSKIDGAKKYDTNQIKIK